MTITDEDSRPSTRIIIPGTVRPPVKLTANPDVYVSVNTPPTIYTVKDGVLAIQEPIKEIPPDMQYSFADAFGGRPSGRATGEGATITWEQLHSGVHAGLNVFASKNGGSCSGQAVGQNAQGEYVKFQCVIYGYFVVSGNSFHKVDALPADLKRHVTGGGPQ